MNPATLFQISYGLYVLSAKEGERDNACIINTVMQVTDIPKRLVIAVNKSNLTHDMIQKSGAFNLSILDQSVSFGVFEQFGFQSGRQTDKFKDFEDCKRSENGLYYLTKGTCGYISASVVSRYSSSAFWYVDRISLQEKLVISTFTVAIEPLSCAPVTR